jgi:hypothetical protein
MVIAVTLREKITAKQGEKTDTEFARLLGMSRPEWHNIRTGKRKVFSTAALGGIMAAFPDLTLEVMEYIKTLGV